MSTLIDITVYGLPAPQGSKRSLGKGVMVESSKHVAPWRDAVRTDAASVWAGRGALDEPLMVYLTFRFPRPKSHYGTGANAGKLKPSAPLYVSGKPDVDKLERSTLDGLTSAGIWVDDARVVRMVSTKTYTDTGRAHADIRICDLRAEVR